jgi:hypothetical protein
MVLTPLEKRLNPKHWIYFIITCTISISLSCADVKDDRHSDRERIQQAVRQELKYHPEARLVDLYKLFFQEAFGPGHMIRDESFAREYLREELNKSTEFDSLLWRPAGYRQRFYRLNLVLVKNETIPLTVFLEAFVNSANSVQNPSPQEWRKEWRFILSTIEQMDLKIPEFAEDKVFLAQQLAEGNFAVHHSQIYRKLYHPHYRIVNKHYFEKLKKEFLSSGEN